MPPVALLSSDVLRALEAVPDPYLILAPDAAFTILTASTPYLAATSMTRASLQGQPLFEAFPPSPFFVSTDGDHLHASLQQVLRTRQPHQMPVQRYDLLAADGTFVEKYWEMLNIPVLDEQGQLHYLLHKAVDVTTQVQAHAQAQDLLEAQDRQLLQVLTQVPAAVAIVSGAEHRYTFLNARYQALVDGRAALGRCVADVLPELVTQGFVDRLNTVYQTGHSYHGQETRLVLQDAATKTRRTILLDFTYQALRNRQDLITGVVVFAVEVTSRRQEQTIR